MGALSELRGKTRTKVYEDTIGIKFHYTVRNENRIQMRPRKILCKLLNKYFQSDKTQNKSKT